MTRERRDTFHHLDDPAAAVLLGGSLNNYSGESVNETSAMTLSGVYRAVTLISTAIAALPLKSYRDTGDDQRERVTSFLDNPAGPDNLTPFEWKETVLLHLLLSGEAFLYHLRTDGGAIVGLEPIHPMLVEVQQDLHEPEGKVFYVTFDDGSRERLTTREITHICGPHSTGLRGKSFVQWGANSLGIALAADRSTATMFRGGAQVGGVLTPEAGETITPDEAKIIRGDLDEYVYGRENAGKIPLINRIVKFSPWQMTNADAQWLESRVFQLEEIARWTGVPPYLLMQIEKQSSWGTGIAESNTNFGQYVLLSWCKRITDRLSRLLASPRWCEFDMAGLEAGSAQEEITLLMAQVNGGFLTLNEARRVRNLPAVTGGDALRVPSGVMLQDQLEANVAATEDQAETEEVPA